MVSKLFPNFKKNVSDFLSQEDGKISKQNALLLGTVIMGAAISSLKDVSATVSHTNSLGEYSYNSGAISISHSHHATHATHSSY